MDQLTPTSLKLTTYHLEQMVKIAQEQAPLESCGVIAGQDEKSIQVIEITNRARSSTRYQMDDQELIAALWNIDKKDWTMKAFFHSHPASLPAPSQTDLIKHHYPEIPMVIIGRTDHNWIARAFIIQDLAFEEIPII